MESSTGLAVISDLDPDQDLVAGDADSNAFASSNDHVLDAKVVSESKPKLVGGPKLVKQHDDKEAIMELLEDLAKPAIEAPKNGKFTKDYLFTVLTSHCDPIVEERKVLLKEPGENHHTCKGDVYELQTFIKKFLEEQGVASGNTLRKQITLRKTKSLYNWFVTEHSLINKAKTFNNDGNFIAVANGIIHVQDGKYELLPYEANPHLNFKHRLNANFDLGAKHYYWDSFLPDFIGTNDKDIDRFWETESNLHFPNPAAKSITVQYGKGNDGKSVLGGFRRDIYTPGDAVFDGDLEQALSQFGTEAFNESKNR